jgi:signal transduction histidine kinase
MLYFNSGLHYVVCLLSLSTIALLYLWLKRQNKQYINTLQDIDHKFFYYKNLKNNKEYISKSLKNLLALPTQKNSFENLMLYFQDDEKEDICKLHTDLSQNLTPKTNSAKKIRLNKKAPIQSVRILGFHHVSLKGVNKKSKGFFIFFADLTEVMLDVYNLEYENNITKKELANKNKILNTLPIPIWLRSANLNIDYFNTKFGQIVSDKLDYNQEAVEISKDEKKLALKAKHTSELQSEERYLIVNEQRRLYNFHEIPTSDNKTIIGMAYDVTSKDQIRTELDRHISAQSDLLESTASATAIYGADTKLKFFNHAFVKLWELDEKWLVSQPTYGQLLDKLREQRKLPEQSDFQEFKKEQLRLFTDLMSTHNDFFYLPDGRSLRIIVVQHAFGGLLFSYEDMTDRLALERSYKTLTAVQKETIDNLNEGIIVINENGKIAISNSKFAQVWNINYEEMRTKLHITELLEKMYPLLKNHKKWPQFKEKFIYYINIRKTNNLRIEREDESILDILFAPLPDGATLVSFHDITDSTLVEQSLRERNQALQDSDKLKTEFLANISYELRSPLTSIIGFSESLSKKYFGPLNIQQNEYISAINDSSRYLMGLINDILDLASIDAGYMELEVSKFNIHKSIVVLADLIRERIKENKLNFRFYCNKNIGYMLGDVLRIKQVIFKLVSNAIEHSKKGGTIKLKIQKIEDQNVDFIVEDNGYGIPQADQKRIFEKFSYIEGKNKIKKSASKLGLSIVKSFIELHGGHVAIESKVNKGSRFICTVPLNHPELIAQYNIASANKKSVERKTKDSIIS